MNRIYLDHNATTPMRPEVQAALAQALAAGPGNPSSPHSEGRAARDLVERSRGAVARLIGADPADVVFTSGGTESDNLGIRGAAHAAAARARGRRAIVSSPLEHPAVSGSLAALAREGFTVRLVAVDGEGRVDLDALRRLVGEDTALVTFALANHELGTLHPVTEIARIAHAAGALVHCDAVQAAGRVPLDVGELAVDLLSLSAHKLYGPQGVGALWHRRDLDLPSLLAGGHQERERRPGTENVLGIAGFGVACVAARDEMSEVSARIGRLRDRLEGAALAIEGARRFGAAEPRVPGTSNVGFAGVEGELLMASLDLEGVAISTGAACTSGSVGVSPVVLALGLPRAVALTAARFSLGRGTTEREVDVVAGMLPAIVARIRAG